MRKSDTTRGDVDVKTIVALFKQTYKRGPWPNQVHCYDVAVAVNIVRKSPRAVAKNDSPDYRKSRATVAAMRQLIDKRKKAIEGFIEQVDLRLPDDIEGIHGLNALERALSDVENVLCPSDPRAGTRRSAAWHKPAQYLAEKVEDALRNAEHKTVSRERDTPFIRMMVCVLELVGECRAPGTIAAALRSPPGN